MPIPDSYAHLSPDELRERLALAEAACVLVGWTAASLGTPGHDAATQAWMEWAHHVGSEYTTPKAHPDLNERRVHDLSAERKAIRDRTLDGIRKQEKP